MSSTSNGTAQGIAPFSRTSSPSFSSSSHPLRREVYQLVDRIRANPKDSSPYSTLIPATLDYINGADTGGKQFHFFCSKNGPPETALHTCMLRVLSFKSNPLIQQWLSKVGTQLHGCVECYKGFILAKEELKTSFLAGYSELQIERFLSFLDEWEEGMAKDLVRSRGVGPGDGIGFLSPSELFAVLTVAAVRDGIYDLFKQIMTPHKLATAMKPVSPGLLRLAMDEDPKARRWAAIQVEEPPFPTPLPAELSRARSVRKVLLQAAKELSDNPFPQRAQQIWAAIANIVCICAPDALATLSDLVFGHLHEAAASLPHILQVFDHLLKAQGLLLWEKDRAQALVSLASVLDNPDYVQAVANVSEKDCHRYTHWMRSFLASLMSKQADHLDHSGSESLPSRRQETPPTMSEYGEVLKRLTHFLLERMQNGTVVPASRRLLFDEGISILMEASEAVVDLNSPTASTISEIVGLYARPITTLVFRGHLPMSSERLPIDDSSRQRAKNLVLAIFEADQSLVADAIRHLSQISQQQLVRWKQRSKPGHPKREEIYNLALQAGYPLPNVCAELWSNAYQSFGGPSANLREMTETASIFLKPLSKLTLYGEPNLSTHVLPSSASDGESPKYVEYKKVVKACIVSISRRLRILRGELPMLLAELSESDVSSHDPGGLQEQCVHLSAELVAFNLSPVPEQHKAAQNVVRAAYPEVESRADVFRALLCASKGAVHGVLFSLDLFVQACGELVEANDAAKWIVRSGADILDVLCNRTRGLLRPGAEHSLVDRRRQDKEILEEIIPSIWELMCRSIAVIFAKTPKWSEHIAKEDMVAWFRDVTIFASQLTEEVDTVQRAVNARRRGERERRSAVITDEEEESDNFILSCLGLPLEQAISWLRINDAEIVAETLQYIIKALDRFGGDVELPPRISDKILNFVKEQLIIDDPSQRKTVLSVGELLDLQARLDPSIKPITISDGEDDGVEDLQAASTSQASTIPPAPRSSSSSTWLSSMTSPTKSQEDLAAAKEKRRRMKQQKLSFAPKTVIDVDSLDDDIRRVGEVKALKSAHPSTGRQQSTSSGTTQSALKATAKSSAASAAMGSANKYKSASSIAPSRSATLPKSSHPSMIALRKAFTSQPRTFPLKASTPRRVPNINPNMMREPRAPAASSTLTGTAGGQANGPTVRNSIDNDVSSSSEEDDDDDGEEEGALKGLAALTSAKQSPTKGIKLMSGPMQQSRRTMLLEDSSNAKALRERQEAERKRMLRSPPNLQPLHLAILSWDWYHSAELPPAAPGTPGLDLHTVPKNFANANEYSGVFGPLLMLEAWAQLQSAKDDFSRGIISMYSGEVSGRVSVDAFVDVSLAMSPSTPRNIRLGDTDVVVLRQRKEAVEPSIRPSKDRIVLAKVEQVKTYNQSIHVTLRCALDNDKQGVANHLVNRSVWEMGALFNLSTLHREFAALLTSQHYDLSREILQARITPRRRAAPAELQMMKSTYGLNDPQAEAVLGALSSEGFTLVQGPPGTGKTKTICSLVAHFVATRKSPALIAAGGRAPSAAISKKLLMCAPSNAAIDEVAKRAKLGFEGPDGRKVKVNVVRLGRDEAINAATKDISLDALVDAALAKSAGQAVEGASVEQLLAEVRSIRDERERKQSELEKARASFNEPLVKHLEVEIRSLASKRMTISQKLDDARDKKQTVSRQMEADRRRVRTQILLDADVICSTLAGAGHEALLSLPIDFETVVIDEAAQAVELSTLIPLRYGCKRCIMVGDPRQLPPTVLSKTAEKYKYSQSLFVRLFEQAKEKVYLLSIQYRMHPDISMYPSQQFYEGRLVDGPGMAQLTAQPWHSDLLLQPYRFFSIRGVERSSRGHSFLNVEEAQAALALYERLRRAAPGYDFDGKVGCVTMYKGQVDELKRVFAGRYGPDIDQRVDFNTVDGFQGQEKEVIILSCVRSGKNGLGFLTDGRRINVAITRAKSNLFIVGDAEGLRDASTPDGLWRKLLDSSHARGVVQPASLQTFASAVNGRGPIAVPKLAGVRPALESDPSNRSASVAPVRPSTPTKRMIDAHLAGRPSSTKRIRTDEAASSSPAPPTRPVVVQPVRPGAVGRSPPGGINSDNLPVRRAGQSSTAGTGVPVSPALKGNYPPRAAGPPPNRPAYPRPPATQTLPSNQTSGGPSQAALDAVFVKKKKKR